MIGWQGLDRVDFRQMRWRTIRSEVVEMIGQGYGGGFMKVQSPAGHNFIRFCVLTLRLEKGL